MKQEIFDTYLQADWGMIMPPTFTIASISPAANSATFAMKSKRVDGANISTSVSMYYTDEKSIRDSFENMMASNHLILPTPEHYDKVVSSIKEGMKNIKLNLPSIEVPL